MASYFDTQPSRAKQAPHLRDLDETGLGKRGLMSPAVESILGEMGEHSSSGSDDNQHHSNASSDSGISDHHHEESPRGRERDRNSQGKNSTSSSSGSGSSAKVQARTRLAPPRPVLGVGREKHPHLARFHSLRSMLFSSHIEESMIKHRESESEAKWRTEHESRQGLNRPRTPESPPKGGSPGRDGISHKLGNSLRKLTSRNGNVPTMRSIQEDEVDNESTASDDELPAGAIESNKKWDEEHVSDGESINHSDIEDLVRWTSRRDPPSDGEGRRGRKASHRSVVKEIEGSESGHESLGNEDVNELLRWVSSRNESAPNDKAQLPEGYSDASTVSDSDDEANDDMGDDDVNELVQWISRREGPNAGPVKKVDAVKDTTTPPTLSAQDSNTAELARWVTRQDETSGESDFEALAERRRSASERNQEGSSLAPQDVDEIVQWVSDKHDDPAPSAPQNNDRESEHRDSLRDDDVPELIRWVSHRHDGGQQENEKQVEEEREDEILKWKQEEDQEKKEELGMSIDQGSLSHGDLDELVGWVGRKKAQEG